MPPATRLPTIRAMKILIQTVALACALVVAVPLSMARQDDSNAGATIGDGPDIVHEVPRLDAEMTVDGRLDEPFWADAVAIAIDVETRPGDNIPASVGAVAYLVDNGRELLVGFRAEDPDPSQIRAFLRDRDSLWNDDFIGLTIDTFDDQRRGYEFYINPLGAQGDLIIEEASGNEDSSWDGLWDSAGQITDFGYTGEMRIPYSTLRFQKSDAPQQWSVDLLRFRPRDYRYRLSNNRLPRGANCYLCELSKLRGFADASPGRDLEVTPTLTVRSSRHRSRPDQEWRSDGTDIEPGVDVKWGIGPNTTLNATLNPDFSQVEVDQAQLDLNTTFALFFPEKRPFFLEGADYFSTPLRVVYTRTVSDPDYGLRMTGREGRHTYGVFAAQDTTTQVLIPGVLGSRFALLDEDALAAAGRYRYDFDGQASIGAVATLRDGDDYSNRVIGIDGRWQRGKHVLIGQFMNSSTDNPMSLTDAMDLPDQQQGNALTATYDFTDRNYGGYANWQRFDPGFRADLGFISQVGFDKGEVGARRTWYRDDDARINKLQLNANWDITHAENGQLLERELEAYFGVNGPMQSFLELGGLTRVRYWAGQLFDEHWGGFYGEFQPRAGMSMNVYVRRGRQIDFANAQSAQVTELRPGGTFNIARGLSIEVRHTWQRLSRDGGDVVRANLTDLRIGWQLDLRQRLRLALQRGDMVRDTELWTGVGHVDQRERRIDMQLIYSYKINPRTALYAGYSEGRFANDTFNSLFPHDRSLFAKLSYAWQP